MPSAVLAAAGADMTGSAAAGAGWLVVSALASGILSMWLYARLEPRKRIRSIQRLAARVQRQMQAYDGDFSGAMALAGKNLALAERRLRFSLLPALVSGIPVVVVMAIVLPAYDREVLAVGPAWLRSATASFCLLTACAALLTKLLMKRPGATKRDERFAAFAVPCSVHLAGGLVHRFPRLWISLGNLETWTLCDQLAPVTVDRPIFIAGIARSGSTILLEALAAHPDAATHKYRDYPGLFTPYWWDRAQQRAAIGAPPRERAHGDRIAVTPDSPEAMEEMLWMAFFPQAHDPQVSNVLGAGTRQPQFEAFYKEHVCKLLLARRGRRYVSKGNYNLTRLGYLLKMFPGARFVVPVRQPESHLASLIKQHRLFCAAEKVHPRALAYLQRVGHFEFGLDRRPVCVGDPAATQGVLELWRRGEEVRGLARYWAQVYGWLADELERNEELQRATLVVRYEELCQSATVMLRAILEHCQLDATDAVLAFAERLHEPAYYRPQFSADDLEIIAEETDSVAQRLGYAGQAPAAEKRLVAL